MRSSCKKSIFWTCKSWNKRNGTHRLVRYSNELILLFLWRILLEECPRLDGMIALCRVEGGVVVWGIVNRPIWRPLIKSWLLRLSFRKFRDCPGCWRRGFRECDWCREREWKEDWIEKDEIYSIYLLWMYD